MLDFQVEEDFLLNGEPIKLLSGAIHYFRIHPKDWYHSLYNLKALGFNTVELYVPWNLHETKEGYFDFERHLDVVKFVELAGEMDLLVIVRPSPYICAELEFGGLPAWLLEKGCHLRSSDEKYLQYVDRYYAVLLKKFVPLLATNGGPIIMMQIENEYGSFGDEKEYLRQSKHLMEKHGINVPLFTSDGSWRPMLESGTLVDEGVFPTVNFGSNARQEFENLTKFMERKNVKYPLMCMEFWDGWFNEWGKPINTRDVDELVEAIRETIELGSINLFMFHGGTNFGFTNGTSMGDPDNFPQITSYDYGAPLNEQGNPTAAYYEIQKMLKEILPEVEQMEPLVKKTMEISEISLKNKVSLWSTLSEISECQVHAYPQTMEELNHYYGYVLYESVVANYVDESTVRIVEAEDRCHFYRDEEHIVTQYQSEIGEEFSFPLTGEKSKLSVLVENIGRNNYGFKIPSEKQRKGIRTGIWQDNHFVSGWQHYLLDFTKNKEINFMGEWVEDAPGFYQYTFDLTDEIEDTFLDVRAFGKGIVLVNGFHIGRFWDIGPTLSLYVAKHFLKEGENEIIIFETEGRYADEIQFLKAPLFKDMNDTEKIK